MTANSRDTTGSGWSVESQIETTQIVGQGQVVQGMNVSFITGKGVRGTVFVPDTMYSPDTVRTMIAAKAAQLDAVADLTHNSQ